MGIFGFFSYTSDTQVETNTETRHVQFASTTVVIPREDPRPSSLNNPSSILPSQDAFQSTPLDGNTSASTQNNDDLAPIPVVESDKVKARRFSVRPFGFAKHPAEQKPALSSFEEQVKREHATEAAAKRAVHKAQNSRSDKQAKKSALVVRSLIVGPTSAAAPKMTPAEAKPQLSKIKSQLLETKSANKLIAQLRELPATGEPSTTKRGVAPIHAVCLEHTDAEEHALHFAKLAPPEVSGDITTQAFGLPGVESVPVEKLAELFKEMHVIDLVKAPDLGLGQPGSGDGLLAGALPTAGTVIEGVKKITPELMALGYATGRAFVPDHTGMYPPTDRMSVITYWWGLEILLPPPSLAYLSTAQSVTGAVMNFLSAVAMVNNGVREILPFVRYIAQFIDFEFAQIKRQDRGEGVVCAATWIMPAAMVPRPWDFPVPPPVDVPSDPTQDKDKAQPMPKLKPGQGILLPPSPSPMPLPVLSPLAVAISSPKATSVPT